MGKMMRASTVLACNTRPACSFGLAPSATCACKQRSVARPAAAARELAAAAAAPCAVPPNLSERLATCSRTWVQHCIDDPLVDQLTGSRIHVLGVTNFAFGTTDAHLAEVMQAVQPTMLALEQPYDTAAREGRPYPQVLDAVRRRCRQQQVDSGGAGGAGGTAGQLGQEIATLERPVAKLGRDMLDPFEVLGLYGSVEYVLQPEQLVECSEFFGFVPGADLAGAVDAAELRDVAVHSIDAPLRLQEAWVGRLTGEFTLDERYLARQLQQDTAAAEALLPQAYHEWDRHVSDVARRLDYARQQEAPVGGAAGQQPSSALLTAFKVSKAVAAGLVPYGQAAEAFRLQASLQPLKFRLFFRRAEHMALQVRDLCQRMCSAEVLHQPAALDGGALGAAPAAPQASSGAPPQTVLLVVGRQYVHMLEGLWADSRSRVWRGDVPRKVFAQSQLEPYGPPSTLERDPDVLHGGSRPVGQKPMSLGS